MNLLFFNPFITSFVISPKSVAILIFFPSCSMLNPHESIASCDVANGVIFKSPISNFSPILNFSFSMPFQVPKFAYIGILYFFAIVPILLMWSICSCVTNIAFISFISIFILSSPSAIFFALTPAIYKYLCFVSLDKQAIPSATTV